MLWKVLSGAMFLLPHFLFVLHFLLLHTAKNEKRHKVLRFVQYCCLCGIWSPRHQPLFWTLIHGRKFLTYIKLLVYISILWPVHGETFLAVFWSLKGQSLHSPNLNMYYYYLVMLFYYLYFSFLFSKIFSSFWATL